MRSTEGPASVGSKLQMDDTVLSDLSFATPPTKATSPGRLVVSMRNVSKRFSNGTLALKDMTLDVGRGEFLSLLGPSGCGKSTALRIIAGLGEPSNGTIDWPSSQINKDGKPQGDIGFVFQEPTLMPWATVWSNVYLPLRLSGVSKSAARPRIAEVLASVGLGDFHASYPRELSGGMKMRVSIARALVTKPKLLLMDEPFAALDEITRQKLNDDVLRLWRETGITVIFVTHSVFESAFLSNRIVVMRARPGQVYRDLPIETSLDRDSHYRTSEEYRSTTDTVSRALQEAIEIGASGK
jgi:NitT/TauT family transport system ATP-binding protein